MFHARKVNCSMPVTQKTSRTTVHNQNGEKFAGPASAGMVVLDSIGRKCWDVVGTPSIGICVHFCIWKHKTLYIIF